MSDVDDVVVGQMDRRSALKKAAAAAGVVAWTTPVVQTLAAGSAFASTFTNCRPSFSFTLVHTIENCSGINAAGFAGNFSASCCSGHTYYTAITSQGCGASCGGTSNSSVTAIHINWVSSGPNKTGTVYAPKNSQAGCARIYDLLNCNAALTVYSKISATVTCADGLTYNCVYFVTFDITAGSCLDLAPGLVTSATCAEAPAFPAGWSSVSEFS